MNFITITSAEHPSLKKIQKLYEEAFPRKERRDFSQLLDLITHENMVITAVDDFPVLVGFFIQWEFKTFSYIEHLAIDPAQRGKNYGSAIMKKIIERNKKELLLEVEPPHDNTSKKRILFYERLGMKICPFYYEQPPYRKNENPFPMLIMSFPHELSKSDFVVFTSTIKAGVYERWK